MQPEEYKIVETIYDMDDEDDIFNKPLQDDLDSLDRDIMDMYDPKRSRREKKKLHKKNKSTHFSRDFRDWNF